MTYNRDTAVKDTKSCFNGLRNLKHRRGRRDMPCEHHSSVVDTYLGRMVWWNR